MYHTILASKKLGKLGLTKNLLYIMHLQKDYVLWCYEMQTTLKATEDCLFKSVLCQVPAVLQKAFISGGMNEMPCETGSPSDSCTENQQEKKRRIVFYSVCF